MRYSQRRYSPLGFLSEKGPEQLIHVDQEDMGDLVNLQDWFVPKMRKFMPTINKGNIINPSEPFLDAALQAGQKNFLPNIGEFADFLDGTSGVILQSQVTIFYSITQFEKGNVVISFIVFANITNTIVGFSLPDKPSGKQQMWFSSLFDAPKSEEFNYQGEMSIIQAQYLRVHYNVISVLLFKKYATVETKEFLAGQKTKYLGQKCINDTKYNITHLDSKWFTNIVRSAGFEVRGHFRLQPYGPGMKERKLIWIEAFEKTGYTAPARKLKSENL